MVSLIICDVLPCNYSEQGIWVDDESQGQYYNFFKDKDIEKGCKKWYNLITPTIYNWFWDIYTNYVGLSTLSNEQVVMLIHPDIQDTIPPDMIVQFLVFKRVHNCAPKILIVEFQK